MKKEAEAGPKGSITACHTGRADLLGFKVHAKIEKEDTKWMARTVEAAFSQRDEVDIIIIMWNYEGAEFSAVFNAEALQSQAQATMHVRKYAVVGAPAWAKAMINAFSPLSPVTARTFDLTDERYAWEWVNQPAD